METQVRMEMAHSEYQEERTKEPADEIAEEQFLKDLYLFMKKRDTPIERIPHLGFKQIDLFVMFKTVNDYGGYQQVTAQQLWKQVYNKLGGNPRSTSAATCTRRHYEKLLLPYECHVKGIIMSAVPDHQPKPFNFAPYGKEYDDGQRPAKRKMLPLHQGPHHLQSDPHRSLFPLPLHYPHYYHPGHTALPPYVPVSSSMLTPHSSPAPKPQFPFPPSHPTDPCLLSQEPLEQLRYLAEQYKSSSGLTEPLNLSKKAPTQEIPRNPISSFSPPSSSKNPKFLNKPSTLYTTLRSGALRNEGSDTQDDDSSEGVAPYPFPVTAREAYVVDVEAATASSSPVLGCALTLGAGKDDATEVPQKPSSPKTDFAIRPKEGREARPEVRGLGLPRQKDGKMEIEIPLSVFHNWLKLYGPSMREAKEPPLPAQEEHSGQRNWCDTDILPTNLTFHTNPRHQSSAEDLRLRNVPSPSPTSQTTSNYHNASQNHLNSYKPLPSGGILKNAASRDISPFDQQVFNKSYISKSPDSWDAYDKETRASPARVKSDSSPLRLQQDFASKFYAEDVIQGGKSETAPSALLMVNSSSLLHLTNEEVIKLKKMISSSS